MPGRSYNSGNQYRYGFNSQEHTSELNENSYTAEFWQYDARIVRRWNLDPKPNISFSPYAAFLNNPIWFSDPSGDTSILTPGGKAQEIGDNQYETFNGGVVQVGNLKIQPAKGTLKSFTVTGEDVDHGAARFVAMFDKKTGAFTGYAWDKKLSYTWEDFKEDFKENLLENAEHENDPLWDPTISREQAAKNAINIGLTVTLPNPILKTTTAAANAAKTTVLGKYPDYVNLGTRLKGNIFNIAENVWNKMTASEQWAANVKFLDKAIERGDKIVLSNPVKNITEATGTFRKELEYLISKGYKLSSDGTQMLK